MNTLEEPPATLGAEQRRDHSAFMRDVVALVERDGPAQALRVINDDPRGVPVADGRRHYTLAAFFVWAADWLLTAGLEPWEVLWHPLVDANSPLAWYDAHVLASVAAHEGFITAPVLGEGAPTPVDFLDVVDLPSDSTAVAGARRQ